jgi:uncharacterized membrane protein (DUF485 family)
MRVAVSKRPQNGHYMTSRASRIGLSLFAVYLVLYGGFVLLAAFSPESMEATPLAGVNLAIWYGFGLIVTAFVLALVYGWTSRAKSDPHNAAGRNTGDQP